MCLEKWLNEVEVSELVGRSVSALRQDRMYGRGLPYVKLGRQVRYRMQDLAAFSEENLVKGGRA